MQLKCFNNTVATFKIVCSQLAVQLQVPKLRLFLTKCAAFQCYVFNKLGRVIHTFYHVVVSKK